MARPKADPNGNGGEPGQKIYHQCLDGVAKSECGCGQLIIIGSSVKLRHNPKASLRDFVAELEARMPDESFDFGILNGCIPRKEAEKTGFETDQ